MGIEPLLLIAPLLIAAAYCDLRFMRIPNSISLILVAVFVVAALLYPPPDVLTRLTAASIVFGLGFTAFGFHLIGAGDVKLLSALVLFIPANGLILFANLFSASLLIGVASILLLRRSRFAGAPGWKSLSGSRKFPMGISIALAGLAFPAAVGLNT